MMDKRRFKRRMLILGADGSGPRQLVAPGAIFAPLTLTRAQASSARSTALAADGVTWVEYAADVPRFNDAARRLLIGGQRTNAVRNPRFEGGIAGTVNNGVWSGGIGSHATNMGFGGAFTCGLDVAVTYGAESGLAFVDMAFSGTVGGGTAFNFQFEGSGVVAATASQAWANSVFMRLVSGTLPVLPRLTLTEGGTGVVNTSSTFTPTASMARFTQSVTTSGGAVTSVRPGFNFDGLTLGATVAFRVRFYAPQLEQAAFASSPILPAVGTPAASTRGADLISAPLASLGIGANGACTLLMAALVNTSASSQHLLQIDNGTNDNRLHTFLLPSSTSVRVERTLATVAANADMASVVTAGAVNRIGMTVDGAGRVAVSVNGSAVTAVTGGPTSGLTTIRVGTAAGALVPLFGEISRCSVLPYAVSDAALSTMVAGLQT